MHPKEKRYHGLYIGEVRATNDPSTDGRVRVMINGINQDTPTDNQLPWAKVGMGFGVEDTSIPQPGTKVYVMFLHGDIDVPIVVARVVAGGDIKEESNNEQSKYFKKRNDSLVGDEPAPRKSIYPNTSTISGTNYAMTFVDDEGAPAIKMQTLLGCYYEIVGKDINTKAVGGRNSITVGSEYHNIGSDLTAIVGGNYSIDVSGGMKIKVSELVVDGDITCTGTVKATTDVVAGLISLTKHKHPVPGITPGPGATVASVPIP